MTLLKHDPGMQVKPYAAYVLGVPNFGRLGPTPLRMGVA